MIKKLLFKSLNKFQLLIVIIGGLIGFTLLNVSIHYFIRVSEFGKEGDILQDKAILIQKKVSTLGSLNILKTYFDEEDIEEISDEEFVEIIKPVINNNFNIAIQTASELLPYVRSDIFVQSISEDLLVLSDQKWDWNEGDEYVPIILPQDFLVMLNSFASAKGFSKISEDLAKNIGLKITIGNDYEREVHKVRIFGFTSEISSILVPESFMKYGNEKYPTTAPVKTTQLMVKVKQGKFGVFEQYLKESQLETKESSLMIGKLKSISIILFSILIVISIISIFLASLVLIQFAQLLISRNEYEIRTLLRLGYSPSYLIMKISAYFIRLFALVIALSFVVFILIKLNIDKLLTQNGIYIATQYSIFSIIAVLMFFLIYFLINYFSIKRAIFKVN